jgi:hypothetical protein
LRDRSIDDQRVDFVTAIAGQSTAAVAFATSRLGDFACRRRGRPDEKSLWLMCVARIPARIAPHTASHDVAHHASHDAAHDASQPTARHDPAWLPIM